MKKFKSVTVFLAVCALALSLTACKKETKVETENQESEVGDTSASGKIKYSLNSDGRKWKVVNDNAQDQLRITQYILDDEQPENVSELFTVTEMSDVNITPSDYFSQFITELQKRYSNVKVESKVINQKTHSLLGEWWIEGQSPDQNQHEWIRILKKGNNIAVLRYSTTQTDQLEQKRKTWESILNDANF